VLELVGTSKGSGRCGLSSRFGRSQYNYKRGQRQWNGGLH